MNKRVLGAVLILAIGLIAIIGFWFLKPRLEEKQRINASNAANIKGELVLGKDSWFGYFPACSSDMKEEMGRVGWLLKCVDIDDYGERMKQLKNGKIHLAMFDSSSFILNSIPHNFSGVSIAVVDISNGGDAIVAWEDKATNVEDVKKSVGLRVAYTPDSPSHFLNKAVAENFGAPQLLPRNEELVAANSAEEVLNKLLTRKADAGTLWEPYVTKALNHKGIVKIIGTEDTDKLIVDHLFAGKQFVGRNSDVIDLFLEKYFLVLSRFMKDEQMFIRKAITETGLSEENVRTMIRGIKWVDLTDNCKQWFAIGENSHFGVLDSFNLVVRILRNAGDFSGNPIPGENPYVLTNSSFLERLYIKYSGEKGRSQTVFNSLERRFDLLGDAAWKKLEKVGGIKIEQITFSPGTDRLDTMNKTNIDEAADRIKPYHNYRILIEGHTNALGDKEGKISLSENRAEAVARYLIVVHGVDPNRIKFVGHGDKYLLPKKDDESDRAWNYRLSRVEITLMKTK